GGGLGLGLDHRADIGLLRVHTGGVAEQIEEEPLITRETGPLIMELAVTVPLENLGDGLIDTLERISARAESIFPSVSIMAFLPFTAFLGGVEDIERRQQINIFRRAPLQLFEAKEIVSKSALFLVPGLPPKPQLVDDLTALLELPVGESCIQKVRGSLLTGP